MKKEMNLLLMIFGIIVLFFISSCTPRLYLPVRNPTPLFKNKGDVYIDASYKPSSNGEITAGYAITDNLAMYAGYLGSSLQTTSPYKEYSYGNSSMKMTNIGVGFYKNQLNSDRSRFEIFGDWAFGHYDIYEEDWANNGMQLQFLKGDIKRISLLMNFGTTNLRRSYTQGYSMRVGGLFFSNNTISDKDYWRQLSTMLDQSGHLFLEHSYFGKVGRGPIKFQFQIALYHASGTGSDSALTGGIIMGIVINPNIFGKNKTFYERDDSPVSH